MNFIKKKHSFFGAQILNKYKNENIDLSDKNKILSKEFYQNENNNNDIVPIPIQFFFWNQTRFFFFVNIFKKTN